VEATLASLGAAASVGQVHIGCAVLTTASSAGFAAVSATRAVRQRPERIATIVRAFAEPVTTHLAGRYYRDYYMHTPHYPLRHDSWWAAGGGRDPIHLYIYR
jgi:hypothetical protein